MTTHNVGISRCNENNIAENAERLAKKDIYVLVCAPRRWATKLVLHGRHHARYIVQRENERSHVDTSGLEE